MNDKAFETICGLFSQENIPFKTLTHAPCRTSAESAATRTAAGSPLAVGAKAILCKLYFNTRDEFAVFVMPGPCRLEVNAVKDSLLGLRKLRFATSEEMMNLCGVLPGCMPPFGKPVFKEIALYVDTSIFTHEELGFNAADFGRSIVVSSAGYRQAIAGIGTIIKCATQEVAQ